MATLKLKIGYLSILVIVAAMIAMLWVVACGSGAPKEGPGGTGGPMPGAKIWAVQWLTLRCVQEMTVPAT